MRKGKKLVKLIKSAKMGNPQAMYKLGIYCEIGKYDTADMENARQFMECAAELGYEPAKDWLKDYHFDDDSNIQANS